MFRDISKDRLIRLALNEVDFATSGWLAGPPQEEIALLSRLTERLLRQRRRCDVGTRRRVSFSPQVEVLHRRGPRTTDLYGCDLAVTLDIPAEPFCKTACFQLKRSDSGKVILDRTQLQAVRASPFRYQSFVLATDRVNGEHRLAEIESLPTQGGQHALNGWLPLADWLVLWLDCQVGTRPPGPPLEDVLRDLFSAPYDGMWDLPEGFSPLRVWLVLRISSEP
jgi:hypothetical protein